MSRKIVDAIASILFLILIASCSIKINKVSIKQVPFNGLYVEGSWEKVEKIKQQNPEPIDIEIETLENIKRFNERIVNSKKKQL